MRTYFIVMFTISAMFLFIILSGEEKNELLRKDVLDLKRGLNEEIQEKELIQKTAGELRQIIKKEEADKVDLQRIIQEAKHKHGSEYLFIQIHCLLKFEH